MAAVDNNRCDVREWDQTNVARLGGPHGLAIYTTDEVIHPAAQSQAGMTDSTGRAPYCRGIYGIKRNSNSIIQSFARPEGLSAMEACCVCGKGF
jgi:hypothetical protein